jgi:glutathione S-transferase
MPQIPELGARGLIMWGAFIDALDARLAERNWIATDSFSFADITALVTIDFARSARFQVPEKCRAVARWHEAASARPSAAA